MTAAVAATPTVAITDLANHTGNADFDAAGPGVAALLVSRLVQTGDVTVVERAELAAILEEQQLSASGLVDPSTAVRAGRLIGARYLVTGDLFSVQLPQVAVTVRVVDSESGEVVLSRDVSGDVGARGESFFRLVDDLAEELLGALSIPLDDVDRARWEDSDLRELEAILAYGRQIARQPMSHPHALIRDDSLDHLGAQATWEVWDQRGSTLAMPGFARRVGDRSMAERWEADMIDLRARSRRNQNVSIGLFVGGIALAAASPVVGDGGSGALYVGSIGCLAAGGISLATGSANRGSQLRGLMQPSMYYTPDEADRWIGEHNEGLQ